MMPFSFESKLEPKDMYRFHLYHAYTGMQGILSVIVSIAIIILAIVKRQTLEPANIAMYIVIAVGFFVYVPLVLWFRSKKQVLGSEVMKNTLYYTLEDEGITVETKVTNETATLPWDCIYKIVITKHNLLIYGTKVNAYVVPLSKIEDKLPQIKEILKEKVEVHRLRLGK